MSAKIYISPEDAKKVQIDNKPKRPFPILNAIFVFIVACAVAQLIGIEIVRYLFPCAILAFVYGYTKQRQP